MLFDVSGRLAGRCDRPHRQIVNDKGWVEHDAEEIYQNVLRTAADVLEKTRTPTEAVVAAGISNQRETGVAWDDTGRPLYNAIVWQCPRGEALCRALEEKGAAPQVQAATGLRLSPYFTAAKFGWLMRHVPAVQRAAEKGRLRLGTVDAWLLSRLTGHHCTDYSNASRTQLFNIHTLRWDEDLCALFGVPVQALPRVCDSNAYYGHSTFGGLFPQGIAVHCVLGDSHAALFAQGCTETGLGKATYGTGSSVMIQTGARPLSSDTLVTSLAWGMDGQVRYVLEGNLNYTGAVISWLKDGLGLIERSAEAGPLAASLPGNGGVYLVPAFSGLGAPYWNSEARATLCGMTRNTTRAHIVRAAEECIAYQIADIVRLAGQAGVPLKELRVDGGPTRDAFLMQFQADILGLPVQVSGLEELSGAGVAYGAGLAIGLYTPHDLAAIRTAQPYTPQMPRRQADALCRGWAQAVAATLYAAQNQ